ncbi:hypothetical protein ACFQ8C_27790 [Streptomyces sp. NPDC056503]|uniref:hypothetical protein n=1 Tax=Streptomyces sp. NPDC056503 TaxID=3345842 RepID=UPI0036B7990F
MPSSASGSGLPSARTSAGAVAYSTGPSGTALIELLHHLGLADALAAARGMTRR